eukprot:465454-Rhodomonas_salina.2
MHCNEAHLIPVAAQLLAAAEAVETHNDSVCAHGRGTADFCFVCTKCIHCNQHEECCQPECEGLVCEHAQWKAKCS